MIGEALIGLGILLGSFRDQISQQPGSWENPRAYASIGAVYLIVAYLAVGPRNTRAIVEWYFNPDQREQLRERRKAEVNAWMPVTRKEVMKGLWEAAFIGMNGALAGLGVWKLGVMRDVAGKELVDLMGQYRYRARYPA